MNIKITFEIDTDAVGFWAHRLAEQLNGLRWKEQPARLLLNLPNRSAAAGMRPLGGRSAPLTWFMTVFGAPLQPTLCFVLRWLLWQGGIDLVQSILQWLW